MIKKFKNIFYLITTLIFISSIISFYFSDKNIQKTNKTRSFYSFNKKIETIDIPLLKNDTTNIVEYKEDVNIFKKKKKKYLFWDLIKKSNE